MSRKIILYAQTDLGRKRTENEDNFIAVNELWGKSAMALSGAIDGVGGYEGGAEAALLAKNTIENYLQNFSFGLPLQLLKEAIINANNKIIEQRQVNYPNWSRMSCVLSVAVMDADKEMMYIGHVGDSRAYIFRNGSLLKVTKDHSTVGMKEDNGFLTEEEAMHHPLRNEINKMLGETTLDAEDTGHYIDMTEHSFLPDDIALFCSDGLSDLVNRAGIINLLSQELSLQQKAQLLIAKANELGGKDNITVALATYKGKKSDIKKIYKRAIEVPIEEEGIEEVSIRNSRTRKKKDWLLLILPALIIGFLANWWGTKSFIYSDAHVVDSTIVPVDSLFKNDSLKIPDTLINATDTINKTGTSIDSAHY